MRLEKVTLSDLENLKEHPLASLFFASSEMITKYLGNFNMDYFKSQWRGLIESGAGVILFIYEDDGARIGMLGGIKFPELNTGRLMASETFWFVHPGHRGCGKMLLDAFEDWAKEQGCEAVSMVYLSDLMPEVVKGIYEKRGYKPMEVQYVKEVSKCP